jgi:hypothetical protein
VEYLAAQVPRCSLGLDINFPAQNLLAYPILAKSLCSVAGLVIEPHKDTVHGLLKRVDV